MENLTIFMQESFNIRLFDFNKNKYLINIFTKDYDNDIKIIISIFLTFFISYFGFKTFKNYKKKNIKEEKKIIILDNYFNKGLEEFNNLPYNELSNEDKKNIELTEIDEVTPIGLVKMKYSLNEEAFIYYSNEDIPYKYLEVVSRLLVNKLKIRHIYIDYVEELLKARDMFKGKNLKKESDELNKKNSIYMVPNNKKLPENTKYYITPEKSNKYIKKGKLRDLLEELKIKEREENKNKKIQEISFKDYKKNKN